MAISTALRSVTATRYVTPFREGGSLPGLMEADDDGLYVTKFRGAGQGLRALVAEGIVGELARLQASEVRSHLDALVRVAEGHPDGGPIAAMPASERFGWLVAPSSTVIQPSDVHTGRSEDPRATLDALFAELVS